MRPIKRRRAGGEIGLSLRRWAATVGILTPLLSAATAADVSYDNGINEASLGVMCHLRIALISCVACKVIRRQLQRDRATR